MAAAPTNGVSANASWISQHPDPDDEEYQKELQRPAVIKEDMKQMEQRTRVSQILKCDGFRSELEDLMKQGLKGATDPESSAAVAAIHQLNELLASAGALGPSYQARPAPHPIVPGSTNLTGVAPIIPINDLRHAPPPGEGVPPQSKSEKMLRCKLASFYRVIDMFGWTHSIYNHITCRVSAEHEHFLINPFGLLYNEVTASSLVKVDVRGEVIDPGCTSLGINSAGFVLHSAIHAARPDIRCVLHFHHPSVVAVSALKDGLLAVSQEAAILGEIGYHDYRGIVTEASEKDEIVRDLGSNKVLMLRNHGVVVCGETIEETYHLTINVVAACEAQIKMAPLGFDRMIEISEETRKKTHQQGTSGAGGVAMDTTPSDGAKKPKWRQGELEFAALMRQLDSGGFRTGYPYRHSLTRGAAEANGRAGSKHPDIEVPPTASSLHAYLEGDEYGSTFSPAKHSMVPTKSATYQNWLTTPNNYMRINIEEGGSLEAAKKITKWVPEGTEPENFMALLAGGHLSPGQTLNSTSNTLPTHYSSPVKLTATNQFAPISVDKREMKSQQKNIKSAYYQDKKSAGPTSKLLDGSDIGSASLDASGITSGDNSLLVKAASRGIIQRDFQNNAAIYKSYFAANPFDKMTDEEIAAYCREVSAKRRGEWPNESPASDSQPVSPAIPQGGGQQLMVDPLQVSHERSPQHYQQSSQVVTTVVSERPIGQRATIQTTRVTNGQEQPISPTSSGGGAATYDGATPTKKKDKKKGFRIPSFSSKKKDKAAARDTVV